MNPRAISYIRMSTQAQRLGHSEQRQVEKSIDYAQRHNLELLEQDQLSDLGVSAFRGKNVVEGQLGQFLTAVKNGRVAKGSYLLIESLDRLSRERVDKALRIFLDIIHAGINVVTIGDD